MPDQNDDRDARPDLQQAVKARADALARGEGSAGEGGKSDGDLAATGDFSGNAGTGGEVKNQDSDSQ
ncbi:hypothetical protein [Sphingomonas sp.]|uniref:hypothetical protein n=1 Tax=Sphingomonas sp. TaxID=28214 RepID=UPI003CC55BA5